MCKNRNDEWGNVVLGRIDYAQDLPAVEARYHQTCSSNFRPGYQITNKYIKVPSESKRGRPANTRSEYAFREVIRCFEDNENKQITVSDLLDKNERAYRGGCLQYSIYEKETSSTFWDSIIIIIRIG